MAEEKRMIGCIVCFNPKTDRAHIRSRGAGGPDTHWNIVPMCRFHHTEQHKRGWVQFVKKYDRVKRTLEDLGWELTPKLWHPELRNHVK